MGGTRRLRARIATLLACAAGGGLALTLAAPASATDYCVGEAACVSAGGVNEGSNGAALHKALEDAESHKNVGGPDRVLIGPGKYASSEEFRYSTEAALIRGAGAGATVLSVTAIKGASVFFMESTGTVLEGVTIEAPAATDVTGLIIDAGTASHVAVAGLSAGTSSTGVKMNGGAFSEGSIAMPTTPGNATTGVEAMGGEVSGSTISGEYGGQGELTLRRDTITANLYGVISSNDRLTVEDTLFDLGDKAEIAINLVANAGPATATLRHLTIVNGAASSRGVIVEGNAKQSATATLANSVIAGVEEPLVATAEAGSLSTVKVSYSSEKAAADVVAGAGAGTAAISRESQLSESPGFVHAVSGPAGSGDWRLAGNSALVDAADPAALAAGESASDRAGAARISHGRRDAGAFEFQWPTLAAAASVASATTGQTVEFSGAATAPEGGDSIVAYQWSFDDGAAVAAGAKAKHAFATPGSHTATLTATDAYGLAVKASVSVAVTAVGPVCNLARSCCGTAKCPMTLVGVFLLKIGPKAFKAARRGGSVAGARGARVSYTQGSAGRVSFTVQRVLRGIHTSRGCVRARRGLKGRSCKRRRTLGSFLRAGAAGAHSFVLTGRLHHAALPAGSYVLVARLSGVAHTVAASAPFTILR